ncbi:hypothetical protein ILUMI_27351 [Ignelater luminosus]|uniref:Nuclease HARBI1 n=1 Tax=Ignelater luminosus TaxID=2038154 RepID=A0A8K0C581_IGNLU|nr:hypothetical protein ILUMI_27351 [Ignelater luminosus]
MSDLSSLSCLSFDEEEEPLKIRMICDRNNPWNELDDFEFKMIFRFAKETVIEILYFFADEIKPRTFRNKAISPINQLLLNWRFSATDVFQQVIGDSFNMHKATVYRVVAKVTRCIARNKARFVTMQEIKTPFESSHQEVHSQKGFRIKIEHCLAVIVACVVLHNIALDHNDAEPSHDAAIELQQKNSLLVENVIEDLRLVPGAN